VAQCAGTNGLNIMMSPDLIGLAIPYVGKQKWYSTLSFLASWVFCWCWCANLHGHPATCFRWTSCKGVTTHFNHCSGHKSFNAKQWQMNWQYGGICEYILRDNNWLECPALKICYTTALGPAVAEVSALNSINKCSSGKRDDPVSFGGSTWATDMRVHPKRWPLIGMSFARDMI
jgi:hypothetical protein